MLTGRKGTNSDNFIMLPTVDFCFKELMQNPKVRKGFIAAILGKVPETIRQTTLIPTELQKRVRRISWGFSMCLWSLRTGRK